MTWTKVSDVGHGPVGIADGPRTCFQCSTVFEFEGGLPAEVRWSAAPCLGCERWFDYLEAAKRKAAVTVQPEQLEAVDLSSISAIQERLRAGRTRQPEAFDARMAAAHDVD